MVAWSTISNSVPVTPEYLGSLWSTSVHFTPFSLAKLKGHMATEVPVLAIDFGLLAYAEAVYSAQLYLLPKLQLKNKLSRVGVAGWID